MILCSVILTLNSLACSQTASVSQMEEEQVLEQSVEKIEAEKLTDNQEVPIPLLDGVSKKEEIYLELKDEQDNSDYVYIKMFKDGFLNQGIPLIKALYNVPDRILTGEEIELLAETEWNFNEVTGMLSKEEFQKSLYIELCLGLSGKAIDLLIEDPDSVNEYRYYTWFAVFNFDKERIVENAALMEATEEEVLAVYQEVVDSVDIEERWEQYVDTLNTMSYNQINEKLIACECWNIGACDDSENRFEHAVYNIIKKMAVPYTQEYILSVENERLTFTDNALQILEQYKLEYLLK